MKIVQNMTSCLCWSLNCVPDPRDEKTNRTSMPEAQTWPVSFRDSLLSLRTPWRGWHFQLCWTFTDYIVEKRIESRWSNFFLSSERTVMSWWGNVEGLDWERCGHTVGLQWGGAWRAWTVEEYWGLEEGGTQNQGQGEKEEDATEGQQHSLHTCI